MKTMRDFDHIHNGKGIKRDNEKQPKEQYKKCKIDNCRYCGVAHG